jgi:hypothetical protein
VASGIPVGALYATLNLDKSRFDADVRSSKGGFSSLAEVAKKSALVIGAALLAAASGVVAFGIASIDNAVEQERAWGRVVAVFGDSGDEVNRWAEQSSRALGVTDDALELSVANFAEWAKNAGVSTDAATEQAQAMAIRASEISLATGKSYDEVFGALQKGAQGSHKGLKEFGVAIDTNAIRQQALTMGLWDGTGALDASAAAQARSALILQQTTAYQEQAAGMTGTLADSQRKLGVVVDEVQDTVGAAFMNVAQAVLPVLLDAFTAVSDWVGSVIPTVQATLGGFLDGASAGMAVIGDTILPALGAAFEWLTANILPPLQSIFQTWAENVLPALQRAFAFVQGWIADNWPLISKVVGQVAAVVKTAMDVVADVFRAVMPVITKVAEVAFPLIGAAATVLLTVLSTAFDAIGAVWNTAWGIAKAVAKGIGDAFSALTGVFRTVGDAIGGVFRGAMNALIGLVNGIIRAVNSIQVHIGRIGLDTPAGFVGVGPFDWPGLQLPEIRYLQTGTRNFAGGWAMLGERGPELARLPRGTDVFSSAQSRDLLAAGSGRLGPLIGSQTIYGVQAGDIERETRRALRRAALAWSLEGA